MHFVCPWHGYEYDLKTGECVGDRKLKLRKFEVVKRGDDHLRRRLKRSKIVMDMPRNDVRQLNFDDFSTAEAP